MADQKKNLSPNDKRFINSLSFDDLDFDDLDLEEKSKGPVSDFKAGLKAELKNPSNSILFFRRMLRLGLPEGYLAAADVVSNAYSDARSIASDVRQTNAGDIATIATSLENSLPKLKSKTPEKLYAKLEKAVGEFRERAVTTARVDLNGTIAPEDQDTQDFLARTFTGAQTETAKMLDQGSERRFQQERLERRVRDKVESVKSQRLINELRTSNSYLKNLNAFNEQYESRWMRSTLEIQYRTFQAIRDIRTLGDRSYRAQVEGFKSLIHNSAMPEFLKQDAGKYRKARGTNRQGIADYHMGFGDQFRKNLMSGASRGTRESLAGIAGMLSMGMGDMGVSKSTMAGSMVGTGLAGVANMLVAPYLAQMMMPYARKASNRTGGMDHWLSAMLRSAPGLVQKHANNWGATGINGILHRLASQFGPRFARDPYLTQSGFQNSDQAAQFNQMTQRSIVEVIPGYLSKLLYEVRSIRSGSSDTPMEVYNFSKGTFTSERSAHKDLVDRVVTPQAKDALRWTAKDAVRSMDQNGDLSKEARTALAKQLTRDAAANRHFDPSRYVNEENYGHESDAVKAELSRHFKKRYDFDDRGRLQSNLNNNRRLDTDTRVLQGFNYAMPKTDNEIRRILDSGRQEDLVRLGIVKQENGVDMIDTERLFDLMIDNDDYGVEGGEGGDPTGPQGGGAPYDEQGRLLIPLYTRGARTPSLTPKTFNSGGYFNKRTGQRIHSMLELEDTIVDGQGNVVVSLMDLKTGLRDSNGKIVYRYHGMFGKKGQSFQRKVNRAARRTNRKIRKGFRGLADSERVTKARTAMGDAASTVSSKVDDVKDAAKQTKTRISESALAEAIYGKTDDAKRRLLEYRDDPSLIEEDHKVLKGMRNRVSDAVDNVADRTRSLKGPLKERWKRARRQIGSHTPESLAKAVFGEHATNRINEYRSNPELMAEDFKSVSKKLPDLRPHLNEVRDQSVQIKDRAWKVVEAKLKEANIELHPSEIAGRLYGHGAESIKALQRYKDDPELLLEDARKLADRQKQASQRGVQRIQSAAQSISKHDDPQTYRPDIYVRGQTEPVIKAVDFTAGILFDADTGNPIRSANDIKGPVVDEEGRYRLSRGDIEEGLVDHKGESLESISKAASGNGQSSHIPGPIQEYVNRYNNIKAGVTTAKKVGNKIFGKRPPCDVYVSGSSEPALRASVMREGGYFDTKTGRVLESPDDIRGPIIDHDGNVVLVKEDLGHMEDARGRKIRIPNIVIRAIRKVAGGYWKFTKAYYAKLWQGIKGLPGWAKRNPKTAAAMGGLMFGGPQGALMMAGLGKLFGMGKKDKEGNDKPSLLGRAARGYGNMTANYYRNLPKSLQKAGGWLGDHSKLTMGALGALTGNPLAALGGVGLGGVFDRKRKTRSLARRTKAFLNGKPGKIRITNEEAEDPILFTLTNINNQLAMRNGEYNRSGAWDSFKNMLNGDGEQNTKGGKGKKKSNGIQKAKDFFDRLRNKGGKPGGLSGRSASAVEGEAGAVARGGASAVTRGAAGLTEAGTTALAGGAEAGAAGLAAEGGAAAATGGGYLALGAAAIAGAIAQGFIYTKIYHYAAEKVRDHVWRFRMAQYGVFGDDDMCNTVSELEAHLQKTYPDGHVDYDRLAESGRFFDMFRILPDQPNLQRNALTWLKQRFMPIYQRSIGALDTVNKGVPFLEAGDKLKDDEKARYFKLVYFPMYGITPYSCMASPFTKALPATIQDIEEQYKAGLAQLSEDDLRSAVYSTDKVKDVEVKTDGQKVDAKQAAKALIDIKDERDPETGERKVLPLKTDHAIHAPDKLSPLQQMRYYGYGLMDQARAQVEDVLAFEREAIAMIKTDGKNLVINLQTYKLRDLAFKVFGAPGTRDQRPSYYGYDDWIQYKFLPVLTEWAKGLYALNSQINLLEGDKGISYEHQLKVAKMIYGIRLDWWFSTPSIWDIDYNIFGRYGGPCRKRAEALLHQLQEKAARMPQATELPTTDRVPDSKNGVTNNPTPAKPTQSDSGSKGLFKVSAGRDQSLSIQGLTGLGNNGPSDTKKPFSMIGSPGVGTAPAANAVNSSLMEDAGPEYEGGEGVGGLINDIPMPKVNGNRDAAIPMLQKIASMTGADVNLMAAIIQSESGFDASASAGKHDASQSAAGLGQFTKDTWFDTLNKYADKYGLQKLKNPNDALRDNRRFDPRINGVLSAELIKDNADWFRKNIGRNPSAGDVYMVHFLGRAGALKFFKANGQQTFASVFPDAAIHNKGICFKDKECRIPRTIGEVYKIMTAKVFNASKAPRIGTMSAQMKADADTTAPSANQQAGTIFTDRLDTSAPKEPTIAQRVATTTGPSIIPSAITSARPKHDIPAANIPSNTNPAPVVAVDAPRNDVQQVQQARRQDEHSASANAYYEDSLSIQKDIAGTLKDIFALMKNKGGDVTNAPQGRSTLSAGQMAPVIDTRIKR